MPIITRAYEPFPTLDPQTFDIGEIYRPIIPVKLSFNHKMYKYNLECLIDSGADFNLMPAYILATLGGNLKKGIPTKHRGIKSGDIEAYRHRIKLYIGTHILDTHADFSQEVSVYLLGREDFFKFFKSINFNNTKKKIDLKY